MPEPVPICPFCRPEASAILAENPHGMALRDGFPLSNGHTLIVPRRHIASLSGVTGEEIAALWSLLSQARSLLDAMHAPDGYTIGVNDGAAAGQTVMHLHMHLIPRYAGDVPDPRGGVRWVIPSKADYWSRAARAFPA